MKVIGIDPSLTGTGVATIHEATTITVKNNGDELARLRTIVTTVAGLATGYDLAIIEGLSFGSQHGKQSERAALHWMLRDRLDGLGIPVAVVAPTARAKYATGKGNAAKDAVMIACVQRLPILVSNNNEADAAILLAMGLDHLGTPMVAMPASHRLALDAIDWPAAGGVVSGDGQPE
jgi:crossover junction endodeoxyribonuclease RuvC